MSAFDIWGESYERFPDGLGEWGPPAKSMKCQLKSVLKKGMQIGYEYDFGSTTEIIPLNSFAQSVVRKPPFRSARNASTREQVFCVRTVRRLTNVEQRYYCRYAIHLVAGYVVMRAAASMCRFVKIHCLYIKFLCCLFFPYQKKAMIKCKSSCNLS